MHSRALRVSLCALTACLLLAPAARATDGAATVDARWKKAVLAGDLDGVMDCYAKGAIAWMPGAPMAKGADQIRASYQALFAANTIKDVVLSDVKYKSSGDLSTGWGRYSMTLVPKAGGAEVVMTGRFTEVVERRRPRWVYVVDHASADPAPAPAGKK